MIPDPPCFIFLLLIFPFVATAAQTEQFGDQGDGTYRNPILAADYSDPDVCRLGDDFYMVASTFESSPGVTVLHSKDLVNWQAIGAAVPDVSKLGPNFNWDRMQSYGEGIYAPSIRYHGGKFWVFFNCHAGEGFFQSTATDPAGLWTVTQINDKNGKPLRIRGWTDPCPFWDDDGKAYLASSHPGGKWYSYLFQMTPDGTQLLDADVDKMNVDGGTLFSPSHSSEGNKIYKRNGYYYLVHIEFLEDGHGKGTYVLRSRNIYGTKPDGTPGKPGDIGNYELLKWGPVTAAGQKLPGQGGLVSTSDDRWFYIAQFNRYGSDGRTPNLLPATWIDDWPVPGVEVADKQGDMAWQARKPIDGQPVSFPQGSDEFNSPTLSPQWLWNHQPRADHWSLTERPGYLRLRAWQPLKKGAFFTAGNTISQRRFRSNQTSVITKLDISDMSDGQQAGMVNFNSGKNFATIGVVQSAGDRHLQYQEDGKPAIDGLDVPNGVTSIWFRSIVKFDDVNAYAYSLDGTNFNDFGGAYVLKHANYRGDFVGIFTFNDQANSGYVDIDYFHYEIGNR